MTIPHKALTPSFFLFTSSYSSSTTSPYSHFFFFQLKYSDVRGFSSNKQSLSKHAPQMGGANTWLGSVPMCASV